MLLVNKANSLQATTWNNNDKSLLPFEILAMSEELLSKERALLGRLSASGRKLEYTDCSDGAIDQMESARDFLNSVQEFLNGKACAQAAARERFGMPPSLNKDDTIGWKHPDHLFQGMKLGLYSVIPAK